MNKKKIKICVPASESLENCEVGGFKTKNKDKLLQVVEAIDDEGIEN